MRTTGHTMRFGGYKQSLSKRNSVILPDGVSLKIKGSAP